MACIVDDPFEESLISLVTEVGEGHRTIGPSVEEMLLGNYQFWLFATAYTSVQVVTVYVTIFMDLLRF